MAVQSPQRVGENLVTPILDEVDWLPVAVTGLAYVMDACENILLVTDIGALTCTVTLPDIKQAAGQEYTIRLIAAGGGTLTVAPAEGSSVITTKGVVATTITALTTTADLMVLHSDGVYWHLTLIVVGAVALGADDGD